LSLLLGVLMVALASHATAEDPPATKGPTFQSDEHGLSAAGPGGWKMSADKPRSAAWERLCTFWDPDSSAEAVLSRRPRKARNVKELHGMLMKEWAASEDITVTSMRPIEATELNRQASVVVDATYVTKPKAKSPDDPPPPPLTWRVNATYLLSAGSEVLLYVKSQASHWSRVRGSLERLRRSVAFAAPVTAGPKGEGSYRNDRIGFTCRYPKDYTVVEPARKNHVVQFEGATGAAPVLGVYRFEWDAAVEKDVERMLTYYRDELAGEADQGTIEVSGKQAKLITARATIGAGEQVFFLAIFKRGGAFFRLKASSSPEQAGECEAAFKAFVDTFRLTAK
jgi:hypothetical protein